MRPERYWHCLLADWTEKCLSICAGELSDQQQECYHADHSARCQLFLHQVSYQGMCVQEIPGDEESDGALCLYIDK